MGAGYSTEIQGGYRITKVYENSPASKSGIEIFFDYIIQIDDLKLLDSSKRTYDCFVEKLKQNENKPILFLVYNCRYKEIKEITITPKKWGGNGLLGININYELLDAMNEGARILEIFENSPAFKSGLVEYNDYIIGSDNHIFRNQEDLMNYINYINHMKENKEDELKLDFYVYNCTTEQIRKVEIKFNDTWQGKGFLGCNIANGFLHKIPFCKNNVLKKKNILDIENNKKSDTNYNNNLNEEISNQYNDKCEVSDASTLNDLKNIPPDNKCSINKILHDNKVKNNELYTKGNDNDDKNNNNRNDDNKNDNVDKYDNENKNDNKNDNDDKNENDDKSDNDKINNNDNNDNENDSYNQNDDIDKNRNYDINNENKFGSNIDNQKEIEEKYKDEININNSNENLENKVTDNYSAYVKKMKFFSKELTEIYEGMNKNSELLNNIGINTKMNILDDKNISSDKYDCTHLEDYEEQNIYLKSSEKDKINEYENFDNTDCYYEYNNNVEDEKKIINSKREISIINTDRPSMNNELKKNNDSINDNVDLSLNDFPKAGIIYPTSDLM